MTNPYRGLADHQFWRRGVSGIEHHMLDPIVKPKFLIAQNDKVATAGSCFAQHISRRLQGIGFNYFVTERGGEIAEDVRTRDNYGVFSARYGNLYTTAQLLQLFKEAFSERTPEISSLVRPDGKYVDALRQQIQPEGYDSVEDLQADRLKHLDAVKKMFLECDVFIFTLGLTEAWRLKSDQTVLPIAPGVVGGSFDETLYEFINFNVSEVEADLEAFITALREVNPQVRILLTVSPVPLIATYENQHVLVSTTYSKSVLRVVADQVTRRHDFVDYFPSYEIITGSYAGGLYYEEDHREVNHLGVAHAMRCFLQNYTEGSKRQPVLSAGAAASVSNVVCDEEVIAATR